MWLLNNQTPYGVDRNWVRDKAGVHYWVVAVQATFAVGANGKVTLHDEQAPPALAPEPNGEPGKSSLRCDSELLGIKPGTDVVANACAHAPRGKPASSVTVSLRLGSISKQLVVQGQSIYVRAPGGIVGPTPPLEFTRLPIVYESAYGGMDTADPDPRKHKIDTRNPVGCGVARDPLTLVGKPAPSVLHANGSADKGGPAGFGPLDRSWTPRVELLGTYDAVWEKNKKPLLADDYDPRHELCAPKDQQPGKYLQGGEAVELVNLTPEGNLRFTLPKRTLRFVTAFGTREEEHGAKLSTIMLEPETKTVKLVWQTSLRVMPRQLEYLDATRIEDIT